MLGVLITALFCAGMLGFALLAYRRSLEALDPAARVGVGGLLGLGVAGTLSLLALVSTTFAVIAAASLSAFGLYGLWKERESLRFKVPKGLQQVFPLVAVLACLVSLVAVLAPSATLDWDTLAYHLAVPKLWFQAGKMEQISFIHHSNFPAVVDGLYLYASYWGGEPGAKAFQLVFFSLGMTALYGLARQFYGPKAAGWAMLGFLATPAIFWESGTGYIDVAHGLYAGLGAVFAVLAWERKEYMWVSGLMLAFAAGSKYTGLQAIFATGLLLLLFGFAKREAKLGFRAAVVICGLALAISAPWYVRNAGWSGNPVFPFFYERLGGKNWSQFSADIYREEQQTFGVPKSGEGGIFAALPHAILGIAYQPGRYTNPAPALTDTPQGPAGAQGSPIGAMGGVLLAAGLAWAFSGKARRIEGFLLAWCGLSLLMWFVLSQQSRYIISLAPPLCLLLGGAIARFRAGPILAVATALQALYSFWLMKAVVLEDKFWAATGTISRADYLRNRVPFYRAAEFLNEQKSGKVALYDEVFGYLLDVPYFWANPGHSMEIPYDSMQTGQDLAQYLAGNGFDRVYLSLGAAGPEVGQRWLQAAGIRLLRESSGDVRIERAPPEPYPGPERTGMFGDLRTKWRALLAEAVASGGLEPEKGFTSGMVFRVKR